MAKEHQIYWLSTEESGEDGVGRNWYYIKDARKQARHTPTEVSEADAGSALSKLSPTFTNYGEIIPSTSTSFSNWRRIAETHSSRG